jgi:hypothetical protein
MKSFKLLLMIGMCAAATLSAQETFAITGTAIPPELLKLNYGSLPKGVRAYDLNICNMTAAKSPLSSSHVYQALVEAQADLQPIGRQIMLAAILRNQNRSVKTWLNMALSSTTGVLSVLGAGHTGISSRLLSATALGALVGQQLLTAWSPVLTADQVEKFESEVLEPVLLMDGGSCVERTVFTALSAASPKSAKQAISNLEFHVR